MPLVRGCAFVVPGTTLGVMLRESTIYFIFLWDGQRKWLQIFFIQWDFMIFTPLILFCIILRFHAHLVLLGLSSFTSLLQHLILRVAYIFFPP